MPGHFQPVEGDGVFLNIPFDVGYEELFVALIASVAAARFKPRCAIELPERGEGQLPRIMQLLGGCRISIHDLSRPDRFNMPFELGLAAAQRAHQRHDIILMESRRGRLARRLSDMRIEPLVHGNGSLKLIAVLMDNLGGAKPREAESIYRKLIAVVPRLKRHYRAHDIFRKNIFDELVSGAIEEAERLKLFTGIL